MNAVCKRPPIIPDVNNEYATSDQYWKPTYGDEIKAFVGISILMGLKQMPEYNDYWSNDPMMNDSYIASRMSKNRYEKLSQFFHCSNPADPIDNNDRINKARNFVETLDENFQHMLIPGKHLSVDEAMIKYNGRLL